MDLVFLYGPAAAGKLTTARALSELTGIPVFHNHLVVDTLLTVFPFGSPEFVRLRELYWIEAFREAAASGRSLVFTFTPEGTVPLGFAGRVADVVGSLGGRVHFVRLRVSDAEQERRIENEDRRAHNKLSSLETLLRLRQDPDDAVSPDDVVPVDLDVDTEFSGAESTARAIVEAFGLTRVDQPRGFSS
jgi:chloramphenicol 3-O-phosphotransferase